MNEAGYFNLYIIIKPLNFYSYHVLIGTSTYIIGSGYMSRSCHETKVTYSLSAHNSSSSTAFFFFLSNRFFRPSLLLPASLVPPLLIPSLLIHNNCDKKDALLSPSCLLTWMKEMLAAVQKSTLLV